jgi:hypothetical protein
MTISESLASKITRDLLAKLSSNNVKGCLKDRPFEYCSMGRLELLNGPAFASELQNVDEPVCTSQAKEVCTLKNCACTTCSRRNGAYAARVIIDSIIRQTELGFASLSSASVSQWGTL